MKALDTPLQYVLDHSSFSIGWQAKTAPETPPCQMKLRVAFAHWFHVVVNDRRTVKDVRICLSAEESRQVYNRLRRHAAGHVKMMAWAGGKEGTTPPQAVSFWQSADQSKEGVPDAFLKGLRSHVLAFARSDLLTYDVEQMKQWLQQQAATVDAHLALVTVVDAETVVPRSEFDAARQCGNGIRIISDYVRGKYVLLHGGWLVDGDCFFLRLAPQLPIIAPAYGHFAATLEAPRQMLGKTKALVVKHWELNFLAEPQDYLYLATPFAFPAGSPILATALERMKAEILPMPPPKKGKDIRAMRIWADSFECWGCAVAFARSDVCSPISYLCRSSCRATSESVADAEKIIKTSLCVNNFWQSSARSGDPFALAATDLIAPGSIWHCIYGSVLPERKRKQEEGQDAAGCEWTPPQQLVFTSYDWPPLPQIFQIKKFKHSPQDFLSRYSALGQLGEGTDGRTITARDNRTGQLVCVKLCIPGVPQETYLHELCADHKGIPALYDSFSSPYLSILVMERVATTLRAFLAPENGSGNFKTGEEEKVFIHKVGQSIADALAHVHRKGVLHLDLHMGNILLRADGGIVLSDFGRSLHQAPPQIEAPSSNTYPVNHRPPELFFAHGAMLTTKNAHITFTRPRDIENCVGPALDVWAFASCLCTLCGQGIATSRSEVNAIKALLHDGFPQKTIQKACRWQSFFAQCHVLGMTVAHETTGRLDKPAQGKLHEYGLWGVVQNMLMWEPKRRPPAARVFEELQKIGPKP